jgi:hypothetical protein
VAGKEDERPRRIARRCQRLLGTGLGPPAITHRVVIAGPDKVAVGSPKPGAIPGQPAVMCLQPRSRERQITGLEGEIGGQSLQEECLLVELASRGGSRSIGQE